MYTIKEIYKTIQGEGAQAGRTAVFVRFTGCNLWSGKEKHRASAVCKFCDTDFVGTNGVNGGTYSARDLALKLNTLWGVLDNKLIVFTGGEPMLQLDEDLIEECKNNAFETAIETNGTIPIDFDIDWVCVSPKYGSELVVRHGNELKTVFPQEGQNLDTFLERLTSKSPSIPYAFKPLLLASSTIPPGPQPISNIDLTCKIFIQ